MKILYLELINSAGIWAGMTRKNIKLDFMKSTNKIVMLFGQNGGGKSTILSALHPFTGSTNDERKTFFIDGVGGEKLIHYKVDDKVYMIHHHISAKKKTNSYISTMTFKKYTELYNKGVSQSEIDTKGKELNENGGVKTFNELVKQYLGVDEEFFKISRIGSNVTNFIDLSTSARKNYISLFLPSVEEYARRHKLVNEKLLALNKELKFVSDEINKIDKKETLEENLKFYTDERKDNNKTYEKILNVIQDLRTKIQLLDPDEKFKESDYKLNPYKDEYKRAKKIYENAQSFFDNISDVITSEEPEFKYTENYNEITNIIGKIITKLENKVKTLTVEYNNVINNRDNVKERISELDESLTNKKKQLNGMGNDDIKNLKEIIKEHQDNITKAKEEQSILDISRFDVNKKFNNNINSYTTIITQLRTLLTDIKSKITLEEETILKNIFCNNKMTAEQFKISYEGLKRSEIKEKNEIAETTKKIAELKMSKTYIDILNNRPLDCTIDTCPFIEEALKHQNTLKELEDAENYLEDLNLRNENTNKEILKYENVSDIITKINQFFNDNKDSLKDALNIFGITNPTIKLLMNFLLKNDVKHLNDVFTINDLVQYIEYDNYILNETSKIENIEYKLSTNEKIEEVKTGLVNEINDINEKLEKSNSELNDIKITLDDTSKNLENAKSELDTMNQISKDLAEVTDTINNYNDIKKQYDETEETLEEIRSHFDKLYDYTMKKKEYKGKLTELNDKIDSINLNLNRLKDYLDRKEKLDKNYYKTNLVKEALSPTKGIPVYFIKDYLDTTTTITNRLLDISQKGKFAISFDVSDKDFFIRVFKNNGDVLDDIKDASQGETSLTSLSLSLALMQQSMNIYNIFLLDELDGSLDINNRRAFIEMVNAQIKELNAEQVFIISHNNEFEAYPIDMILLNNHNVDINNKDFMNGKNIIFKA